MRYILILALFVLVAPAVVGQSVTPRYDRVVSIEATGGIETELAETRTIAFHPTGEVFAVAAHREVLFIRPSNAEIVARIDGAPGDLYELAFTSDGTLLAGTGGREITVWDLEAGRVKHHIPLEGYAPSLAIIDDEVVVAASDEVAGFSLETGERLFAIPAGERPPRAVAHDPHGGQLLVSEEWTMGLSLYNPRTGLSRGAYPGLRPALAVVPFDSGRRFAMTEQSGGKLHVFDARGTVLTSENIPGASYALLAMPDNESIAVGSWISIEDEWVFVYNTRSREITHRFGPLPNPIYEIALSPDGRTLLAATKDPVVYGFELPDSLRQAGQPADEVEEPQAEAGEIRSDSDYEGSFTIH